jgi:site-specific recombinase XerD
MIENESNKIHDFDKRLKRVLFNIENSKEVTNRNKELIKEFHDYLVEQGLSISRTLSYVHRLYILNRRYLKKDFDKATEQDLRNAMADIMKDSRYSEWSVYFYKILIRKFYKWLKDPKNKSDKYPRIVRWVKANYKGERVKLPDQMLTESEVKSMIEVARNEMEKAIISLLYESGARASEILGMKVKNVQLDNYGAIIYVNGKTGSRRIRVIGCVPYLQKWITMHPNPDSESWLWINRNKGLMKYNSLERIIWRLKDKAGINKRVHIHLFRHSRATFLAKHLTEHQLKQYFGWRDHRMPEVYVHLAGRDTDEAIFRLHGIEVDSNNGLEIKQKKCVRCNEINACDDKLCRKCGMILDQKYALEMQEREQSLLRTMTEEIVEKMIEKRVQELLKQKVS